MYLKRHNIYWGSWNILPFIMIEILNKDNFILYCMKHYDNPQCTSVREFEEDLNRFLYLQKLLNRYINNKDELRERLILNHLIVLFNLFNDATINILFYKFVSLCPSHKVTSDFWTLGHKNKFRNEIDTVLHSFTGSRGFIGPCF